jgi:hypothetical protein
MRSRSVPLVTLLVLGLLGAWAGTSAGQLPPPPEVSLPTVTVPSVSVPPTPPTPSLPAVTTPVPTPAPPTTPVEPPVEASTPSTPATQPQSARATSAPTPRADGFGASSRWVRIAASPFAPSRLKAGPRPNVKRDAGKRRAAPRVEAVAPRSTVVPSPPRRPIEEPESGALGSALETLRAAAVAVPPALYVLALLAVLLLSVAALPQPLRASWAGAAIVHHRGTIAIAGLGVLAVAIFSAGLLL